MSYEDFKRRMDREREYAVLPRVPHSDPGYIWAPSRDHLKQELLAHILVRLGDDPQAAIKAIEQLRDDPRLRTEARNFYELKLQELRQSLQSNV